MNERQWWRTQGQPKLHQPQNDCLAWKVQDAFIMGRPDVLFNVPTTTRRLIGWLELKYDPAWPVRSTTLIDVGLTTEQFRHLDSWYRATKDVRASIVLYVVGDTWYLFRYQAPCLTPKTKWSKEQIISEAVLTGTTRKDLVFLWSTLASQFDIYLNRNQ